jgi:acyl dehydratase
MSALDLTKLEPGTELPALHVPAISRTTLALFAGASGDHNPIHIDIDFARAAGMEDVFAHGMLSMAYLGRAVTGWVPQERIKSLKGRFVSITPVGGAPVCTGTVREVSDVDGQRIARIDLKVTLASGPLIITGEAVVSLA